jgi:mediator of RNA polymerase II transcription subunit 23
MCRYTLIPPQQMELWINSVGLIMAAMPDSYWSVMNERLVEVTQSLSTWNYRNSPFQLFNFASTHDCLLENKYSYTLALAHSLWHHAGPGQISSIPQ